MKAMQLIETGPIVGRPQLLRLVDLPTPKISNDEVLISIAACGVCHTDLDEIEGRLLSALPIVLGHEAVGRVTAVGSNVTQYQLGDRVGVGWIHSSNGSIDENLSPQFVATGCDVNGGYAQFMTAPSRYVVPIPDSIDDVHAAPLMCAGAIGYRALKLSGICNGDRLGLMGFGASGHLVLPIAKHLYPRSSIYVFARDANTRHFAIDRGADWVGDIEDMPPHSLNAIIDTTPAWKPVVESMRKLQPGGRLVINAIRKEDQDKEALLHLNYHEDLWMEREIKSVANLTYADIANFLPLAARIGLRPKVTIYSLEQANEVLHLLRGGSIQGAVVLMID